MLRRMIVLGAAFLVLLASPLAASGQEIQEDRTHSAGEVGERIVEFVRRAEARGFSGAVLAAKGGEVVAAVGVGSADLSGRRSNTPATLFEIASLTKQFTGAAVMRLVQEGKLALDDPIAKHLPGVPENCAAITVEHLLRHTSGIPGSNSQGGGDQIERVLPLFLRGGPAHEPGTRWEYWNQGYAILSEIIARASGKSYTEYCREALFTPAGMRWTCFTGDEAPHGGEGGEAAVAVGRSAMGPPRSALEHPYGSYGFQYRGMGGVVTNVWDLWRWDRALHDDEVLSEASKAELFKPGLRGYALGWFVREARRPGEGVVLSHGGGVRGFICEMRRYPEHDAAVIVLCNRDDAPLGFVVEGVERLLFGGGDADGAGAADGPGAALRALGEETQAALAGRYRDERGNVLVVEADGVATWARIEWAAGPVTRAILGLDGEGEAVLDDGAERHRLGIERGEGGEAQSITILKMIYRRAEE